MRSTPSILLGSSNLTNGTAVFNTSALALGTHPITAIYNGGATFNTSTSNVVNQLVLLPTTTTLGSNPNPSTVAQSVTFTATVTASSGTPDGSVTFKDGT